VLITALVVDRLQPIWLTDWLGVMAAARVERESGGWPGALPTAEQERSLFLLILALIRLIPLLI
jgi:hypothetical protein